MMHIAIYIRVSSASQDQRSQIADLERWAQSQDEPIEWYKDSASGRSMDRPQWNKLTAAIQRGEVSRIVVWRLDRLGRTAKGLVTLFDDLVARGIGLFSLKDCLDLSTPAGRLMANVLASVAAYETEVRSERQKAGMDAAKAAGVSWGGSKAGRKLSVTDEQIAVVRSMQGQPVSKIARSVGLSRPTVYRLLKGSNEHTAINAD